MRRRKVLRNVQTFAEVRGNGRLNDRAVRTRHQAAHTGKLTNLCGGATSTGVCVDINGVEGFLLLFFAVFVDYRLCREAFHHRLRDDVVGARPDVDHFIVLLALGY